MSGPKVLLDTNVIIGLLKATPAADELLKAHSLTMSDCATSQITRMELLSYPELGDSEEQIIKEFLGAISIMLFSDEIEKQTIQFRRLYGGKLPDAIIAATATVHNLQLLTLDKTLKSTFDRLTESK